MPKSTDQTTMPATNLNENTMRSEKTESNQNIKRTYYFVFMSFVNTW